MSVYDELMNEAPQSPGDDVAPKKALKLKPSQDTGNSSMSNQQRVQQTQRAFGTTAQSRRDAELMFTKTSGTRKEGQLQKRVFGGASDNSLRAPVRQAAGTTYEGPSLREKVEYIRSFLESRTTRREPHRRGDTGRGRNRASRTRMKPYVRNKRRRGGPPPHREEQPKFGTVFPRDTEDAPTTDDSRQKNWNKRNNK